MDNITSTGKRDMMIFKSGTLSINVGPRIRAFQLDKSTYFFHDTAWNDVQRRYISIADVDGTDT